MPATQYLADLISDATAHGTAYQLPDTVYLELTSTTPTASAAGTAIVYTNYARATVDNTISGTGWTSDGIGGLVNAVDIEFPEPGAGLGDTAVAVEVWDADTSGNRLWYQELDASVDITSQTPVIVFRAGELTLTIT